LTANPAAAANEPQKGHRSNAHIFPIQENVNEHNMSVRGVALYACRDINQGEEITWNYGKGYQQIRDDLKYDAGRSCSAQGVEFEDISKRIHEIVNFEMAKPAHERRITHENDVIDLEKIKTQPNNTILIFENKNYDSSSDKDETSQYDSDSSYAEYRGKHIIIPKCGLFDCVDSILQSAEVFTGIPSKSTPSIYWYGLAMLRNCTACDVHIDITEIENNDSKYLNIALESIHLLINKYYQRKDKRKDDSVHKSNENRLLRSAVARLASTGFLIQQRTPLVLS